MKICDLLRSEEVNYETKSITKNECMILLRKLENNKLYKSAESEIPKLNYLVPDYRGEDIQLLKNRKTSL